MLQKRYQTWTRVDWREFKPNQSSTLISCHWSLKTFLRILRADVSFLFDGLKTFNTRILSATTVDNNSWDACQKKTKNGSEGFKLLTLTLKGAQSLYSELFWPCTTIIYPALFTCKSEGSFSPESSRPWLRLFRPWRSTEVEEPWTQW